MLVHVLKLRRRRGKAGVDRVVLRFFEKVCLGQWVLRHGFGGREILGAAAIWVHFGRVLDKALSLE